MIGNLSYFMLLKLEIRDCHLNAPTIPVVLFFSYMMMFALMTPLLVTGAWAERMHFRSSVVFVGIWPLLVYYPVAHAFWNRGGFLARWGVLDFAGGLVIHGTSGVAALVVAMMLETRKKHTQLAKGTVHNVPLVVFGGCLVWACWYSFNGGSALAANMQAVNALLATQLSASMGSLVWAGLSYFHLGKVPVVNIVSGALAGLAGITAASGFVSAFSAFWAGVLAGVSSYYSARLFKVVLHIDDVLDVTALQAIPGISGALMAGLAANPNDIPGGSRISSHEGLFIGGSPVLLGKQLAAIVLTCLWTACMTWVTVKVMEWTVGINISAEDEETGLDLCDHGETAYDDDGGVLGDQTTDIDGMTVSLCSAASMGDIAKMADLVRRGADPTMGDYDLRTPMHTAADEGQVNAMQWLLSNCPRVDVCALDRWGYMPIQGALRNQKDAAVAWLRAHGAHLPAEDVTELLCEAAARADVVQIRKLVAIMPSALSITDYDGRGALHLAATCGSAEAVEFLLEKGADITARDRWGKTPLDDALMEGNMDVANILVRSGAVASGAARAGAVASPVSKPKRSPHVATDVLVDIEDESSRDPLREPLIKFSPELPAAAGAGAESAAATAIKPGLSKGWSKVARAVTQGAVAAASTSGGAGGASSVVNLRRTMTAADVEMCAAASAGDLAEVKRLVKKGANPNASDYDRRSALHLAAAGGHESVVAYLVGLKGININVQDRNLLTPMAEAIANRHFKLADLLATHGATVMDTSRGHSLCMAASRGDTNALERMINRGTNINVTDYDGRTALHLAASENQVETIEWLIKKGADVNVTDRFGGTPLQDAIRGGHQSAISALRKGGATTVANANGE